MSLATGIEWTDATWNPVRGCSRVSEGCRNCYAERIAARNFPAHRSPTTGEAFAVLTDSGPRWTSTVELIESKLTEPLRWKKSRRIFVNSMSDLFHEGLPDEAIDRVFALMALTPHITYQVLTKRAERMRQWSKIPYPPDRLDAAMATMDVEQREEFQWPLPNVWLGVSVENQETADSRISELLRTPAALRFISYEPALGPLDVRKYLPFARCPWCDRNRDEQHKPSCSRQGVVSTASDNRDPMPWLDWVIAGGESGPGARPAHPDWFRSISDQCQAASVPFFFKQWGEYHPADQYAIERGITGAHEYVNHQLMLRVGKKAAGALLDGQTYKQFPGEVLAYGA